MDAIDQLVEECAKHLAMEGAYVPLICNVIRPFFKQAKDIYHERSYSSGYYQGRFKRESEQQARVDGVGVKDVLHWHQTQVALHSKVARVLEETFPTDTDYEI